LIYKLNVNQQKNGGVSEIWIYDRTISETTSFADVLGINEDFLLEIIHLDARLSIPWFATMLGEKGIKNLAHLTNAS
jgi:hypothetical protein